MGLWQLEATTAWSPGRLLTRIAFYVVGLCFGRQKGIGYLAWVIVTDLAGGSGNWGWQFDD